MPTKTRREDIKIVQIATVDWFVRHIMLGQLVALKDAGFNVVTISREGVDVASIEGAGIRHIPIAFTRNLTPLSDLRSTWRLYRTLRKEKPALVHTHTPKIGLLGQLAAWMARVPVLVNTIHGYYFHEHMSGFWRSFYINLERVAALLSSTVFFVSEEDMSTALRERVCPPEKMKLLGPGGIGVDIQRFNRTRIAPATLRQKRAELAIPPDAKLVGFVGRLVAEKGILELLEALQMVRLQVPEVRLLLVGPIDIDKADAITPEIASRFGVEDICIFPGRRADVPELMALMDVLALPSYREGFPVVLMEASAMEVPSIATDVRGCREAVENGRNGTLVPLRNIPALADAIVDLLSDREKAVRMGKEGRKIAEERFDQRIAFANIEAEYTRLMHNMGLLVPEQAGNRAVSK